MRHLLPFVLVLGSLPVLAAPAAPARGAGRARPRVEQPLFSYTLASNPEGTADLSVDDDLDVYQNGVLIYTDGDATAGSRSPVAFEGSVGDVIRLVVRDTYGFCTNLSAVYLHEAHGGSILVDPGFDVGCPNPGGDQGVTHDTTFFIPDLDTGTTSSSTTTSSTTTTLPAGSWAPAETVGTSGNAFDPPPLIAVDDGGHAVMAWAASSLVRVATRPADGSWSAAVDLGPLAGGTGDVGLGIATATGGALVAWSDGSAIRTATQLDPAAWVVPQTGVDGTWSLPAGAAASRVLAAMDSLGNGTVAWEQTGAGAGVKLVRQAAGVWSAPETVPGMSGLSHGGLVFGDDGAVLLGSDSGGVGLTRRAASGTFTSVPLGSGRLEQLAGSSQREIFAVGAYVGGEFEVVEGSFSTSGSLYTNIRQHAAATRPSIQTGSRAGGVALRPIFLDPAAAWLAQGASRDLVGATEEAGSWTAVTILSTQVTSAAMARTLGDTSVVVYTSSAAPGGCHAVSRSPCQGSQWSAPAGLNTTVNSGAVSAAAGGSIAVAAWVEVTGNVRAAIFTSPPLAGGVSCNLPYVVPGVDPIGCASGVRAGLTDIASFPDVAACSGAWSGHVTNGASLCAPGWKVCDPDSTGLQEVTFDDARAFPGCFAYDAAEDFGACLPCVGDATADDMAGMGSGCNAYVAPGGGGCLAGGRIEAACCSDSGSGTACSYKPDVTDGVVCCRATGGTLPTSTSTSTTTTSSTTTATVESTTTLESTTTTSSPGSTETSSTTTTSSTSTTTTLAPCDVTTQCDDHDVCDGQEICQAGFCRAPEQAACTAAHALACVTDYGDGAVTIVDLGSGTVVGTIAVGEGPWGVAWQADGRRVYVTNRKGDSVSVVDPVQRTVVATVAVSGEPLGIAVHPRGDAVYVARQAADSVAVIDPATATVTATLPAGHGPAGVAVHPSGRWLYVANYRGDSVSVIDLTTGTTFTTVPVARQPLALAVDPDGSKVYVASYSDRVVSIIGTASHTTLGSIPVGRQPVGVAFTIDGQSALVVDAGDGAVHVIDATRDRVVARHTVGGVPLGVAADPTGAAMWITQSQTGRLASLDIGTGTAGADVAVGSTPVALGQFIGAPPDDCPAKALGCDDGDPFTMDACTPASGCVHDGLDGPAAVAAGAETLQTLAAGLTTAEGPLARLRDALHTLQDDAAHAADSDAAATRALLRRDLKRVIRALQSIRRHGGHDGTVARLLDIARAARRRVRR